MSIDLHVHSTASDGVDSPTEVVQAAFAAGIRVLALTDHDTTAGWAEATDAARRLGMVLVRGAEISCRADGISVHLLSYLHDPDDLVILAEFARLRADRLDRAQRMVQRIAQDYDLSWDEVQAQVPPGATVGRPHIADALVARGIVANRDAAFERLLSRDSPYYLEHYAPDAIAAVRMVRAAGGVPVIAHPRAALRGRIVSEQTIAELAAAGMLGLEADHCDHTEAQRARMRALAGELGLFWTGSSDYHGRARANALGRFSTAPDVLEAIIAAGKGAEVIR